MKTFGSKDQTFQGFSKLFSFSLSWPHHLSACLLNILLCSVVSYVLLESTKVFASLPDQVRKILVVFFGEVIIGICEILARQQAALAVQCAAFEVVVVWQQPAGFPNDEDFGQNLSLQCVKFDANQLVISLGHRTRRLHFLIRKMFHTHRLLLL